MFQVPNDRWTPTNQWGINTSAASKHLGVKCGKLHFPSWKRRFHFDSLLVLGFCNSCPCLKLETACCARVQTVFSKIQFNQRWQRNSIFLETRRKDYVTSGLDSEACPEKASWEVGPHHRTTTTWQQGEAMHSSDSGRRWTFKKGTAKRKANWVFLPSLQNMCPAHTPMAPNG